MRFADFVKKHFPIEHPKVSGKLAKILGRPKKRRARTVSGFTRGQEVEFDVFNYISTRNGWQRVTQSRRGTVQRTYGDQIYITTSESPWVFPYHMTNVRAV